MHRALLTQTAAPWGLTALLLFGAVDHSVEITSLVPGESIERKIIGGETQRFGIALAAGDYADIILEQRGIDIEASIVDAEGNPLTVFQDEVRPNGIERIELVADAAGTYVLVLTPVDSPRTSGAYAIRMASPRPATEADRQLQRARVLHTRGREMERAGKYPDALALLQQALELAEPVRGRDDPYVAEVVGHIARTYAEAGDVEHAVEFQRRADAILETQMGLYLASGSERQKLAFVRAEAERTDRTISLHLREACDNPDAASLAALVILQRKGRVQDAMVNLYGAVRRRVANPADRGLMDQLRMTTARLARIALGGPGAGTEDGRETLARLQSRKEQLEATLSANSAAFRTEIRPVTLEVVQAAIPGDAVLLEFAVFRPFDPKAERNEDAYGPPHYAAYVIPKHGTASGVDLGAVAEIDPLVVHLRDALRNPSDTQVRIRGRAVDERVLRPLRARLNGATRLLLSPDGGLNLVPFEALVDQRGRYLIERYATTYLTSGRDLLRMQIPRAVPGRPVIFADPLFGEPAAASPPSRALETQRSVTVGSERSTLYFAPLSGSALEGRAIKSLFPDASLLTGRRATKASLERVAAPRILHIASHGFFLDDDAPGRSGGAIGDNPMLRSGLAFAGANLPGIGPARGIMTGLEAASLNLWGTSLVTLSACDTGVGEVRNGEGVYGLRRAFMLAGSASLVMSLWPVTDAVARDTMVAYYAGLRDGFGRGDALRAAKLAIMKRPAFRHPYYWGGFIQSGDWTRLPPVG
jgi:CHAT domain-containing protein